ncbi:PQQ-dependent catabolism-associated CXXCW motif protein [Anderseniella sp. Alg231-50]|uniref:PQQ-dependent catabolism-associated CXXCW motif protein n=1 Tax=Anderseniella sp. Alg231-50 TaxID=1922226 RepID=UPI00307BCB2D
MTLPPHTFARTGICRLALAITVISLTCVTARGEDVAEPDDYRMDHFRAPVPDTLEGARVVSSEQAFEIWKAGNTVFVDVLPQAPKPDKLPKNVIWRDKPRITIKGAAWLPNVGFGKLHETMHAFFSGELETLTGGNKSKPVLFYCLLDCWMSWNAAKRAVEYGYRDVTWYPDGTDGWTLQDYPTETVLPKFPVK